ncbi:enoyl-CoA hydratase/isomerase family protein [Rhizobium sp. NPDC090275]|uniref:enoyl-CoA hydratase/isomerase family protein n=1 Tax=Rhizobium sp. NPDC090275 TaxID=3364498 RepID=UPI00383B7D6F
MSGCNPRVVLTIEGDTAFLTLRHKESLNAIDDAAVEQIYAACRVVEKNTTVRAMVITGDGEKTFSAGGDIKAWAGLTPQEFGRHWIRRGHDAFDAVARLRVPVLAVLNGHTFGGGLELAAAADLRIAEMHVKFGLPEAGLGVIPGWSGTQRTVRRFGPSVVRRMAIFGEVLTAEQAVAAGIVEVLVEKGEGLAKASEIIATLRSRAPIATEVVKMLINAAEGEEVSRVLDTVAAMSVAYTEDLAEGVAAFRDKRKPKFKDS